MTASHSPPRLTAITSHTPDRNSSKPSYLPASACFAPGTPHVHCTAGEIAPPENWGVVVWSLRGAKGAATGFWVSDMLMAQGEGEVKENEKERGC